MPDFKALTVCLSKTTPSQDILGAATAALAAHDITGAAPADLFLTVPVRTRKRAQPSNHTTAGGLVKQLDLARMRAIAHMQYWNRYVLWEQVVAGSPVARPWWHFYDRHTASPDKYTWDHAVQGFLNQPRITRMRTYNAHPDRVTNLPIDHLDAFEAGAHAYATYGWLSAVAGQALFTLDGQLLHPASARHTDQITYLQEANEHLTALGADDHLVALAWS